MGICAFKCTMSVLVLYSFNSYIVYIYVCLCRWVSLSGLYVCNSIYAHIWSIREGLEARWGGKWCIFFISGCDKTENSTKMEGSVAEEVCVVRQHVCVCTCVTKSWHVWL